MDGPKEKTWKEPNFQQEKTIMDKFKTQDLYDKREHERKQKEDFKK